MIYETLLGKDFAKLHPMLQARYRLPLNEEFYAAGTMETIQSGPKILRPIYQLFTHNQFLFPESGENIPFTISNRSYLNEAVQRTDRFTEEGASYEGWYWTIGLDYTCVECSFVAPAGSNADQGRKIVETLIVNDPNVFFKDRLVTLRLAEITEIDEAYNRVEKLVKKSAKAGLSDFQKGLTTIQRLLDSGEAKQLGRDVNVVLGLAFCAMLAEESDDFEWKTWVDERTECAVLVRSDGKRIFPEQLFGSAHVDVMALLEKLLSQG